MGISLVVPVVLIVCAVIALKGSAILVVLVVANTVRSASILVVPVILIGRVLIPRPSRSIIVPWRTQTHIVC